MAIFATFERLSKAKVEIVVVPLKFKGPCRQNFETSKVTSKTFEWNHVDTFFDNFVASFEKTNGICLCLLNTYICSAGSVVAVALVPGLGQQESKRDLIYKTLYVLYPII